MPSLRDHAAAAPQQPSSQNIRPINLLDRIFVLVVVVMSAYQVVAGIDGFDPFSTVCYTIGFGVLLVSGLMLVVLGFEILESQYTVIIATIIPISLSTGLAAAFYPAARGIYIAFAITAFGGVLVSRYILHARASLAVLSTSHAISGLVIFLLPLQVWLTGKAPWILALVSMGGALIGVYGLLLSLAKAGRPVVSLLTLLGLFPVVLMTTTALMTIGFSGV